MLKRDYNHGRCHFDAIPVSKDELSEGSYTIQTRKLKEIDQDGFVFVGKSPAYI